MPYVNKIYSNGLLARGIHCVKGKLHAKHACESLRLQRKQSETVVVKGKHTLSMNLVRGAHYFYSSSDEVTLVRVGPEYLRRFKLGQLVL